MVQGMIAYRASFPIKESSEGTALFSDMSQRTFSLFIFLFFFYLIPLCNIICAVVVNSENIVCLVIRDNSKHSISIKQG